MQAPASHARFSKRRVQRRLFSRRSLAAGERGGFFRFFLDALFSTEGTGEVLLASSPSALWKGKGGGRVAASFQLRRELKIVRAGGCRINNGNNFSFEVLACNSSPSCWMPGSISTNTTRNSTWLRARDRRGRSTIFSPWRTRRRAIAS